MTRGSLVVVAIGLCMAGAVLSGILLQHHVVATIGGDPLLDGMCHATASASCDEVIASKWGRIEWGGEGAKTVVPTAFAGFAFFAMAAAWFVVIGWPRTRRWLNVVPIGAAAVGVLASAGFEYLMWAVIGKWCPLCVGTHVITLGLLLIVLLLARRGHSVVVSSIVETGVPAAGVAYIGHPSARLLLVTLLLGGAVSAAGWLGYKQALAEGYRQAYFERWQEYEKDVEANYQKFLAQLKADIPIGPDDPIRGKPDAPHTVVVFSDFRCPFCRALHLMLDKYMREFPGQFRIVFKHFPLDKECNPKLRSTMHPGACAAAVAAEAIQILKGPEAFWTAHDALFASEKFSGALLYEVAAKVGLDKDTFMERVHTRSAWDHIYRNVAEGQALEVDSTPAMFFDGRPLKPWGDVHFWKYLLATPPEGQSPASQSQPASAPASAPHQ